MILKWLFKKFLCFTVKNLLHFRDTVTFCQNLIEIFENNSELQFIWDTVKPILLGMESVAFVSG